jgi:hypothetical protein
VVVVVVELLFIFALAYVVLNLAAARTTPTTPPTGWPSASP